MQVQVLFPAPKMSQTIAEQRPEIFFYACGKDARLEKEAG